MALTDVNLRNVVFQEVATINGENYIINPFDLNGNVLESINVTVDTTEAGGAVTLPEIATLNPSTNLVVTVIGKTASVNPLAVVPSGTDTISGLGGFTVPSYDNANLTLRVAGAGSWAIYSPILEFAPPAVPA